MKPDVDQLVDSVLADYSRVEPVPGAVEGWIARREQAPEHGRFWGLPAPAWAAVALALLALLALSWYRAGAVLGNARQPQLAQETTTLQAVAPNVALTAEQKELIHILLTDPGELGKLMPKDLEKAPPVVKKKLAPAGQPH